MRYMVKTTRNIKNISKIGVSNKVLEIISCIQKKKELNMYPPLAEKIALNALKSFKSLPKHNSNALCKNARAMARQIIGVFLNPNYWRVKNKLLASINTISSRERLLKLHSSTSERFNFYREIYKNIFATVKKPELILDLGAGFNTLTYPLLTKTIGQTPYYVSVDASREAYLVADKFLTNINKGVAVLDDISSIDNLNNILKNQLFQNQSSTFGYKATVKHSFIFKTLDGLEMLNPNISKQLINYLISKRFDVTVSFALQSITGRVFKTRRQWFLKIIKNLDYTFFYIPGEVFYVIKSSQ